MPDIAYVQYLKRSSKGVKRRSKGLLQLEPGLFLLPVMNLMRFSEVILMVIIYLTVSNIYSSYKAGMEDKIKNYPPPKLLKSLKIWTRKRRRFCKYKSS